MVRQTCEHLADNLQAKLTLLSASISHKLDYHLSLQYPSDMLGPARQLDTVLWQMLESATGLTIPQVYIGQWVVCFPQVPIYGLQGRCF